MTLNRDRMADHAWRIACAAILSILDERPADADLLVRNGIPQHPAAQRIYFADMTASLIHCLGFIHTHHSPGEAHAVVRAYLLDVAHTDVDDLQA